MPATRESPIVAPENERDRLSELDARLMQGGSGTWFLADRSGEQLELPASAWLFLRQAVHALASGQRVVLAPAERLLSTQQAADVLNISRQHMVRLLERGDLPFSKTGSHRRVKWEDLVEYQREREDRRRQARDRMVALTEELDLYED